MLNTALERFDRRVATEPSALRVDVGRELANFRVDGVRDLSALRSDVARDLAGKSALLKWSCLFRIGQVATMAGLLAFMAGP